MTGINYLDETLNVFPGCGNLKCKCRSTCWAKRDHDKRHKAYLAGKKMPEQYAQPFDVVQFFPDRLKKPLHWKKPRKIGLCFTGDWMDDQVKPVWIDKILEVVDACPQHQFFSLTKQPQNLESKIYDDIEKLGIIYPETRILGAGDSFPNLWNGVSITDQEDADKKLPELLKIPGKHWVSIEPCLSSISLRGYDGKIYRPWLDTHAYPKMIDWIVIGAESGPRRRPCKIEWMIDVVEQCKEAGVPVYVKQIQDDKGKGTHNINLFPPELQVREWVK